MPSDSNANSVLTRIFVRAEAQNAFAEWQAKLHQFITSATGFISLEITSSLPPGRPEWKIIQRFKDPATLKAWLNSEPHCCLVADLKPLLPEGDPAAMTEAPIQDLNPMDKVSEVFVTRVNPEQMSAYRAWIGKMHRAEAAWAGFHRVYVQSPTPETGENWVTILEFDTAAHLDQWLASDDRQKILHEAHSMIQSMQGHRVTNGFAGWFEDSAKPGATAAAWKQAALVLLVLFPIVMLEMKFLNPLLRSFNPALAIFIGNVLSVALITWPLMPITLYCFGWWLFPGAKATATRALLGDLLLVAFFGLELLLFKTTQF